MAERSIDAKFDLIIVGGGIYGIMLALEAVRRELRPLILERHEFAGATSRNSLKIIHGGLRYLQTADFARHRQSVRERQWYLRYFPDHVRPLPCLMPIYNDALRRRSFLAAAIAANDFLSHHRNDGLDSEHSLPNGRIITAEDVRNLFPEVDSHGLKGGALWYDAAMNDDGALARAVLDWARTSGACAMERVEVRRLEIKAGRVAGVEAYDLRAKSFRRFACDIVINAAGPWAASFAGRNHNSKSEFYPQSLAWNIVFRRPALSSHAIALTARHNPTRTYFAVPWNDQLMIGTEHIPWRGSVNRPEPNERYKSRFIHEINRIVCGLQLQTNDVEHVFAGLLPATKEGSNNIARKPLILDHGKRGGLAGFHSVCGVKFTTARAVAKVALSRIFKNSVAKPYEHFEPREGSTSSAYDGPRLDALKRRSILDSAENP